MSFSSDVKNELNRQLGGECCFIAELRSSIRMGGTLVIGGNKKLGFNFTSENAAVTRKVLFMLKKSFSLNASVVVTRGRRLKKNNTYAIKIAPSEKVSYLLEFLGIVGGEGINKNSDKLLLKKICCKRAYLRGAFLGGGYVSKPEGDYHLELVTSNVQFANILINILKTFKLNPGLTDRKEDYIIYLKEGDSVTRFLQIVGANNAFLSFENVRILKNMRNQVNRLVNCETANLQKTVNAATAQIRDIELINQKIGISSLPYSLREVAEIRLENPEATLQELVEFFDNKISKSGINHRLRKIKQIAGELKK